jgi:hypothetical protein
VCVCACDGREGVIKPVPSFLSLSDTAVRWPYYSQIAWCLHRLCWDAIWIVVLCTAVHMLCDVDQVRCDVVPVLCNAVYVLCGAVPVLCDAVPILCNAVCVLSDAAPV